MVMIRRHGPRGCLEENPTHQSLRLGGRYISLVKLSKTTGFDHGYLSYCFSGKRTPSVPNLRAIVAALGMGIDEFLAALDVRLAELKSKQDKDIETAHRYGKNIEKTAL
jgi:transcriptional regulator with XRE-family HTH domain